MIFPAFGAPTAAALVTSGWGASRSYRGAGATHKGLDFRAAPGTPIKAVADGVVLRAANLLPDPAGITVTIDHGGISSTYMHLSQVRVTAGQRVSKGQHIADSGSTGIVNSTPHLHFELRVSNPSDYPYPVPGGIGDKKTGGYSVPAEPLIPASYKEGIKAASLALGIPVGIAASSMLKQAAIFAGVAVGAYLIATYVFK